MPQRGERRGEGVCGAIRGCGPASTPPNSAPSPHPSPRWGEGDRFSVSLGTRAIRWRSSKTCVDTNAEVGRERLKPSQPVGEGWVGGSGEVPARGLQESSSHPSCRNTTKPPWQRGEALAKLSRVYSAGRGIMSKNNRLSRGQKRNAN